ncbi:MAG: SDH family Clp fold serine proteinase [Limnochordia bacterium]|jgi:ClpP class serine protease
MALFELLWIFFIFSSLAPMVRQRRVEAARLTHLRKLQEEHGSRVITLIHRQESMSFLGLLTRRFINVEDSEEVLRAIRMTPDDVPIDLILHTPGGLVLASEQIARAVMKHPARVTVYIPHYAMSGGTMIALAADEIRMDENAVLGPMDPQLGQYPAASIVAAVSKKDPNKTDDETLILADMAEKALRQVRDVVAEILRDKLQDRAEEVAEILTGGRWTHDYPLTCEALAELGIPVTCGLPRRIYQLMELYPQPGQRRPSVQYVPIPYHRHNGRDQGGGEA